MPLHKLIRNKAPLHQLKFKLYNCVMSDSTSPTELGGSCWLSWAYGIDWLRRPTSYSLKHTHMPTNRHRYQHQHQHQRHQSANARACKWCKVKPYMWYLLCVYNCVYASVYCTCTFVRALTHCPCCGTARCAHSLAMFAVQPKAIAGK